MIDRTSTGRLVSDIVQLPTYHPDVFITRDSDTTGKPGEVLDLWLVYPKWCSNKDTDTPDARGGCWINPDEVAYEQCYLGPHTVAAVVKRFGTIPDDDRMCVHVEGRAAPDVH